MRKAVRPEGPSAEYGGAGASMCRCSPPPAGSDCKAVASVRKASIKCTPQSTVSDWSVVRAEVKLIRPPRCMSDWSAKRRGLRILVCLDLRVPEALGRSGL